MTSDTGSLDERETVQALQALVSDPHLARRAVLILREELHAARGSERQAIVDTIAMIERALGVA